MSSSTPDEGDSSDDFDSHLECGSDDFDLVEGYSPEEARERASHIVRVKTGHARWRYIRIIILTCRANVVEECRLDPAGARRELQGWKSDDQPMKVNRWVGTLFRSRHIQEVM